MLVLYFCPSFNKSHKWQASRQHLLTDPDAYFRLTLPAPTTTEHNKHGILPPRLGCKTNMTENQDQSDADHESIISSLGFYLRKLGYTQTEKVLKEEAKTSGLDLIAYEMQAGENSVSHPLLFNKLASGAQSDSRSPQAHPQGKSVSYDIVEREYGFLKTWIENSLDVYRDELLFVLYPIGIHLALELLLYSNKNDYLRFIDILKADHELRHRDALISLSSIKDASCIRENETAANFLQNRYFVSLSSYAFQLLMLFIEENRLIHIIKIVNQYVNIRGTHPKWRNLSFGDKISSGRL